MLDKERDQEQSNPTEEMMVPTASRRGFLKGLGAAGLGARFGQSLNLLKTITTPFMSAAETDSLEVTQKIAELQQKYDVNITTFDAYYKKHPDTPRSYVEHGGERWDIARLNVLDWSLQNLPPHFHQTASNGKKLNLVLAYRSGLNGKVISEKEPRLDLGYDDMDQQGREAVLVKVGHESIHWITPVKTTIIENAVIEDSPWFDQIYQILGGSHCKPPDQLSKRLLDLGGENNLKIPKETDDQSDDIKEDNRFLGRINYGINGVYPRELLGVMGEHYLRWQDYFLQRYGNYMTADQAAELYDFMKITVFLGQEYGNFTKMNPAEG